MDSPPPKPRFWLQFRVYSDGLNASRAGELNYHSTFHHFPNLPPELRLKVWEYLLTPRIILVSCLEAESAAEQLQDLANQPSRPHIPVLLHVNHETRTLALSRYEPAFSWKVPHVLSSMDISPSEQPTTWSEPRVYFDFTQDALYLMANLEPEDPYGFNSPLSYFLRKEDTNRVRRVAVAFRALGYGETGPQQIFGSLSHIVDRFRPVDGKVLVCVTAGDEYTHALLGGESPLVQRGGDEVGNVYRWIEELELGEGRYNRFAKPQGDNVIQKIWRDSYRGSFVTSSLANMQFELIRESELERHVADVDKSHDSLSSATVGSSI